MKILLIAAVALMGAIVAPCPRGLAADHAIAMHGAPLLPAGFAHFPHVDPAAPKGGQLTLGRIGTFDSLNPFIVRGATPSGLREYVYESLLARAPDEPFTLYGLIASRIEVPDDRSAITFHMRPEARFSDGQAIGPDDVLFSLSVLRDKGWPYHRSHYRKVMKAEAVGPHAVRFTFDPAAADRELPLIVGLMPILPRHRMTAETFDRTTLEAPVGSGPYLVDKVDPGRSLVYRRDPNHWASALNIYAGRFNFDEIRIEYFRESSAMLEAFRSGALDIRQEDDPTVWAEGYAFPAARDGRVVKREIATQLPAGLSALVLNTRRPQFADARVRAALNLVFDFEWINRNLYHGLYVRSASLFARSDLAAVGRLASAAELDLLAKHPGLVRADILAGTWRPPVGDGTGANRDNLRAAVKLLGEAGWRLAGNKLVDAAGQPFAFEFLASSRAQERLIASFAAQLARIGITATIRQVDSAQYWSRLKSFDFDMIQWTWSASLSPGNEQLNRWSAKAAETEGSLNYAGAKSPALDDAVAHLLSAGDYAALTAAARALDRIVMSGDYVIPLFHVPVQWIAHWNHVRMPAKPPSTGADIDSWWLEKRK
ncbi:MAG: extracellular solute-binding protein [Hyphomicrobiaceae bacterium]